MSQEKRQEATAHNEAIAQSRKLNDDKGAGEASIEIIANSSQASKPEFAWVNSTGPSANDVDTKRFVRRYVARKTIMERNTKTLVATENPSTSFRHTKPRLLHHHVSNDAQGQVSRIRSGRHRGVICDLSNSLHLLELRNNPGDGPRSFIGTQSASPPILRFGSSRTDPFIKYPVELNRRDRNLIDHLFNNSHGNIKNSRDAWFPVALLDAASFHAVLANLTITLTRSARESENSKGYENVEIVSHHTKALRMVRERIHNASDAISEGNIAAVVAMICHAHMVKDFEAWHQHMSGLKHLLQLRGKQQQGTKSPVEAESIGYISLCANPALVTTLTWADITGSCTQDILPRFPFPELVTPLNPTFTADVTLPPKVHKITQAWHSAFPTRNEIVKIFQATCQTIAQLKFESKATDGAVYRQCTWSGRFLQPLTYRLLHVKEDVRSHDKSSIMQEAWRCAILVSLVDIRRAFGIKPLVWDVRVEKLRRLLQDNARMDWGEFTTLKLWIAVMGGLKAQTEEQRFSFLGAIGDAMLALGIDSYEEVEDRLEALVWFPEFHGPLYHDLTQGIE